MPRQIGERDLRAVLCPARPPAREGSAISPREMPTPAGNPPRFFRRCPEPFSPGGAQRFQSGCGDAARALKNSRCAAIFLAIRPVLWPGPLGLVVFYCEAIKNSRCAAIFFGHPANPLAGAIRISCFLLQSNKNQIQKGWRSAGERRPFLHGTFPGPPSPSRCFPSAART